MMVFAPCLPNAAAAASILLPTTYVNGLRAFSFFGHPPAAEMGLCLSGTPFTMVWIDQAMKRGRDFAFALVKMK